MIYYLIFFIILIFVLLGEDIRTTQKDRIALSIICIIIISLFAGLRDKLWTDWDMYHDFYFHPERFYNDFEYGYVIWNKFLHFFTESYNMFLCVSYIILLILFYHTCYIINKRYILISFIILYGIYILPSSGFRQYIAMNIYFFSIPYAIDRNLKKYLLIIGIAFMFHRTVIFCIPLYWLYGKHIDLKKFTLLMALGIFLYSLNIFENLISITLEKLTGTNNQVISSFTNRIMTYNKDLEEESLMSIGFLRKILFAIFFLLINKKIRTNPLITPKAIETHSFLINIYVIGIFLSTFIYGAFSRIETYFYFTECCLVPLSCYYIMDKKFKYIIISSLLAFLAFMYIYKLNTFYPELYTPYRWKI